MDHDSSQASTSKGGSVASINEDEFDIYDPTLTYNPTGFIELIGNVLDTTEGVRTHVASNQLPLHVIKRCQMVLKITKIKVVSTTAVLKTI